ncbi:Pentulose kinase, partial [Rhizoctonia solani]
SDRQSYADQKVAEEASEKTKEDLWKIMVEMTPPGTEVHPKASPKESKLLDAKYGIFLEAIDIQRRWRREMAAAGHEKRKEDMMKHKDRVMIGTRRQQHNETRASAAVSRERRTGCVDACHVGVDMSAKGRGDLQPKRATSIENLARAEVVEAVGRGITLYADAHCGMLTQRLSWLVAPGRVLDLSRERPTSTPPPSSYSYSYSCSTTPLACSSEHTTPHSSRPTTPTPRGTPIYGRFSMSVRALPAVPGASSSTTTLSPPGLDSRSASVSSLATNPAIRPLPALPPSHSQVSLAATTTSASTVRPLPVPQPAANMSTASLLSVDEAPLGSAGAPVRDPVEENSCLGDRTVNVLAPPRTVSNQDLSGHGSASDSQLQPTTATTTEASQSTATLHPTSSASPASSVQPSPTSNSNSASTQPSPITPSKPSPLARLNRKKRQLSRDLLKFGESVDSLAVPTPSGVDFEMIPQHHMQTQQQHLSGAQSPTKNAQPPTPGKPPRLNLGLFSSRARKESNVGGVASSRRPSTPGSGGLFMRSGSAGSEASTTTTEDPTLLGPNANSVRKRGSTTTGMFRSPSPSSGPGAVGMRKAASAGAGPIVSAASNDLSSSAAGSSAETSALSCDKPNALAQPTKPLKLKSQAQGLLNTAIGIGMSLGGRGSINVMPTSP